MSTVKRCGFTLVELMVVVTLLALVTAVVSVRLGGVAAKARLRLAVDQLVHFDAQTRALARRHGATLQLRIDTRDRTLHREWAANSEPVTPPLHLPPGIHMEEMQADAISPQGLRVGPLGRSASYAVRLSAQQDQMVRWVVVAGVTGQARIVEGDHEGRHVMARR